MPMFKMIKPVDGFNSTTTAIVEYRKQGLSYSEIGKKLGMNTQTCRTMYKRSLKRGHIHSFFTELDDESAKLGISDFDLLCLVFTNVCRAGELDKYATKDHIDGILTKTE